MKPHARWSWLLTLAVVDSAPAAQERFRIERAQATRVTTSEDGRFVVQAQAQVLIPATNPPRFALKSTSATCAPLPDPLFENGFE